VWEQGARLKRVFIGFDDSRDLLQKMLDDEQSLFLQHFAAHEL
jgi:hypothetical protein